MTRPKEPHVPRGQRLDQSRQALDEKRSLLAKMLTRGSRPTSEAAGPDHSQGASAPAEGAKVVNRSGQAVKSASAAPGRAAALSQAHPAVVGMKLWADDGKSPMTPVTAVEHLAGHLLHCAEKKSQHFVLLWPGSVRAIGLAHAVATIARWRQGDKQGLRTLIYPAKSNFLQALNHCHLDRKDLVALAQKLYEGEAEPNPHVRVSLSIKDPFWFSLNSIRADDSEPIHPSLSELLPHFFADKDFSAWKACDGDLLRHVKARLSGRAHKHSLSDLTIPLLSEPATAPDALFAIGWKASQDDIKKALRQLRGAARPEVLLLDATRSMRKDNPTWKANLVRFLECVHEVWPTNPPAALVVMDEPHVRGQLIQEMDKRAAKKNEGSAWFRRSGLPVRGVVCSVARDGMVAAGHVEPVKPGLRDIQVAVTDTEAGEVIELIDRLRNGLANTEWQAPLDAAASYLSRLAALPSSTRVLSMWLEEAAIPMEVRRNYAWPVYCSSLQQMLNNPAFGERARLQRVIDRGNDLWHKYENGTPFARKLADLIEEHTRGTEKCCVIFTRPTAKKLAERYFQTYDGYPEGAGFEVLKDCVHWAVSRGLEAEIELTGKETLIFAGLDEESLRMLILDERISSPAYVLLTRRNAAYLRVTLKAIKALPGFVGLNERVDKLLAQLPDFPGLDERALLNRSDFVLPTFSFEQGLSTSVADQDESDPNAWELVLEDGLVVRRSPQSTAYVYDPALSHTVSRGFRGVGVARLQEGDRVFVMSFELRELTETALTEAGVPISNDKRFESDLREYHSRITSRVKASPGATLTDKVHNVYRDLRDRLDAKVNMPVESTVRNWMDVDRFRGLSFEAARPGAPRLEAHFNAFAKILGLDDFEAIYFWKAVICPLRGVRRSDGRRVSDVYTELLMEPESVVVHRRIKPGVVNQLFSKAKENVHVIEAIRKPNGALRHE